MSRSAACAQAAAADDAHTLPTRVFAVVQAALRRHRMQHYARDCTRDVLLVAHGVRVSFVVDVFAEVDMWRRLLRELATLDSMFASVCLLDLCGEACFLVHEPSFRTKLLTDADALSAASAAVAAAAVAASSELSTVQPLPQQHLPIDALDQTAAAVPVPPIAAAYDGPQFIDVHPSLSEPRLCSGSLRDVYRSHLLRVVRELLRQFDEPDDDASSPRSLALIVQSDDEGSGIGASVSALSLTTLCGYLLDYPVCYCTHGNADIATAAATNANAITNHSNNLGMKALLRWVLEAQTRPEWTQLPFVPAAAAPGPKPVPSSAAAANSSRTLVCSFTVPEALQQDPAVSSAIQRWSQQRLEAVPLHADRCCWKLPLLLSIQPVTLPVVAL